MCTKSKESEAQIQSYCPPYNGVGNDLGRQDISIVINPELPLLNSYYTGHIANHYSRGKIEYGDNVVISRTGTLEKNGYVALSSDKKESDRFIIYKLLGFDNDNHEYILDDLRQKQESILKVKVKDIKTLHKITHIVKTQWINNLIDL